MMKFLVLLFDEEKGVKNKEEGEEWFKVGKNSLLKEVKQFKEELERRIVKEDISEKQYKKIINIYDKELFETDHYKAISQACLKLAGWVFAMKLIFETNVKLAPIKAQLAEGKRQLDEGKA